MCRANRWHDLACRREIKSLTWQPRQRGHDGEVGDEDEAEHERDAAPDPDLLVLEGALIQEQVAHTYARSRAGVVPALGPA